MQGEDEINIVHMIVEEVVTAELIVAEEADLVIKEVDVVVHLMEIEVVEGAVEVIHVDPRS